MEPKLSNACSIYGADMGRRQVRTADAQEALRFRVYHVKLDEGGYDNGGAYWGTGTPLYRALATGETGEVELFVRAKNRIAALRKVLTEYPRARFFRGSADRLDLDEFIQGYLEAALWSTGGDDCEYLDQKYGLHDIAPETRKAMVVDCRRFYDANVETWGDLWTPELAGHDFWLTRNGHGVGFWDRGHGEVGDRLSEAAEAFGEVWLTVGDDGRIYQ